MNKIDPMFPGNFTTALTQFDSNDDGLLDFKEFRELSRRYPLMCVLFVYIIPNMVSTSTSTFYL
jgi:hypothetical protein